MQIQNETLKAQKISDVIQVLNAGIEFYDDAVTEIENPVAEELFRRMISEKKEAATQLQPYAINEQGEVEDGESIAVNVRSMYTNLVGKISPNKMHTYISQLEEVEDKTLEVIREAKAEPQPEACARQLSKVEAAMQVCHDDMKSWQEATE